MIRVGNLLHNVFSVFTNSLYTLNKVTTYYDGTSMTDAKCDGVIYRKLVTNGVTEYFKRTGLGVPKAHEFGIVGDGTDQTSKINALVRFTHIKELVIETDEQKFITLNGVTDFGGIRVTVKNGCKFVGTGTIINAIIVADEHDQVFATTLTVTNLINNEISLKWFGAIGDSTTDDTVACQKAANCINSMNKGTLSIPKGIYFTGKQIFSGQSLSGYSYHSENIFTLNGCTGDIIIKGNGASITTKPGVKIGSFHPVTGLPVYPKITINHTGGYAIGSGITITIQPTTIAIRVGATFHFSGGGIFQATTAASEGATILIGDLTVAAIANNEMGAIYGYDDYNYRADASTMLSITNCYSVTVRDLTLNGNIQNAILGGGWGSGYEVGGIAVQAVNNNNLQLENVNGINQVTDGLGVINYAYADTDPIKYVNLRDCQFTGNGRQGFSWDGGNHVHAVNCDFSNTGQMINISSGLQIYSGPGGGIDIEPEADNNNVPISCFNGTFDNCRFKNNVGISFLIASSGNRVKNIRVNNCVIENNNTGAVWAEGANVIFNHCRVIGTNVLSFHADGYYDGRRTQYLNCYFTMNPAEFIQPLNTTVGNTYQNVFDNTFSLIDSCTFDTYDHALGYFSNVEINSCKFKNNSSAVTNVGAILTGFNVFECAGSGVISLDGITWIKSGRTYFNGVELEAGDAHFSRGFDFNSYGGTIARNKWRFTSGTSPVGYLEPMNECDIQVQADNPPILGTMFRKYNGQIIKMIPTLISDLYDQAIVSPVDGQVLTYSSGKWINAGITLPKASSSVLGVIKIGSGLSIDTNGVVTVTDNDTTYVPPQVYFQVVDIGDGVKTSFTFPHGISGIGGSSQVFVEERSQDAKKYSWVDLDSTNVTIHFDVAPPVPAVGGQNNLIFDILINPVLA